MGAARVIGRRVVPRDVAQCRAEVLDADLIGNEEECALRDHLLAFHAQTLQPETQGVLLKHFVVTGPTPLAV